MTAQQLSFLASDGTIARQLAQEGQARALAHANAEIQSWGTLASRWLRSYAERHEQFAGFMAVAASELDKSFPSPSNPKAFGAVFVAALKAGVIEKTQLTLPHPKRHACPAVVYRSLVWRP